jgi:uncharacterized protein GlcG (DUF336 family)
MMRKSASSVGYPKRENWESQRTSPSWMAERISCTSRAWTGDGALLGSVDLAQRKAKTAVLFRAESGALGCKSRPGGPLWSIENSNDGLVTFGGGAPIFDNEHGCIGGVGVSGGSVEQDDEIAPSCL